MLRLKQLAWTLQPADDADSHANLPRLTLQRLCINLSPSGVLICDVMMLCSCWIESVCAVQKPSQKTG